MSLSDVFENAVFEVKETKKQASLFIGSVQLLMVFIALLDGRLLKPFSRCWALL